MPGAIGGYRAEKGCLAHCKGEGGGALDGELVGIGEYFFNLTEAGGALAEFIPLGALHGKENFVNVAERVLAAAEGGFEFLRDGELRRTSLMGLSSRASATERRPIRKRLELLF